MVETRLDFSKCSQNDDAAMDDADCALTPLADSSAIVDTEGSTKVAEEKTASSAMQISSDDDLVGVTPRSSKVSQVSREKTDATKDGKNRSKSATSQGCV